MFRKLLLISTSRLQKFFKLVSQVSLKSPVKKLELENDMFSTQFNWNLRVQFVLKVPLGATCSLYTSDYMVFLHS